MTLEVKNTLNQLSEDVNAERLNWDELDYNPSVMFSKEINNVSKDGFKSIEENFEQYDGLIYDGAYSEHMTNASKKGLTGNDIDEEKAKEIVKDFVGEDKINVINSEGLSENGTIESYTFTVIQKENEGNPMTIAISKKGGHIVFSEFNRTEEEKDSKPSIGEVLKREVKPKAVAEETKQHAEEDTFKLNTKAMDEENENKKTTPIIKDESNASSMDMQDDDDNLFDLIDSMYEEKGA